MKKEDLKTGNLVKTKDFIGDYYKNMLDDKDYTIQDLKLFD